MAVKERIEPGDTFTVKLEARKPDIDNPDDPYGVPATLIDATARLYDGLNGEWIELGGAGVIIDSVPFTAPQGDRGSIATYLLSGAFTTTAGGTYTLYITLVYSDGSIRTEPVRIVINEYK